MADETEARAAKIYIASRASIPERAAEWRRLRSSGWKIVSSWIDEAGEGQTSSFSDLWSRIQTEVTTADKLILYVEPDDFPLKGALIEVGMALAAGVRVVVVSPGVTLEPRSMRPIGSWMAHPLVSHAATMDEALAAWTARAPAQDERGDAIAEGRRQGLEEAKAVCDERANRARDMALSVDADDDLSDAFDRDGDEALRCSSLIGDLIDADRDREVKVAAEDLCEGCPPPSYSTNITRCDACPRRAGTEGADGG
ncbi:MAG TPA: hypothetical protein VFG62_25935 [Rhodopila sp.]|jgi:hypothetical protein|nr:hypothetical protein [Rhodopila sp.]